MIAHDHLGFKKRFSEIKKWIFLPKYYNPEIATDLQRLKRTHELIRVSELIEAKHLLLSTGNEIGKMAYGTGTIPFVRTSDISNWEMKADPKQGVSEDIHALYMKKQDVREGDIFFVRDGTYLIGQSCIVTRCDLPCLFQSHILKIRVQTACPISRWLIFAGLNAPITKRQIRAKQFTADIIDTVGDRFAELILPIPRNRKHREAVETQICDLIEKRASLRERIRRIPLWLEGEIATLDEILPSDYNSLFE